MEPLNFVAEGLRGCPRLHVIWLPKKTPRRNEIAISLILVIVASPYAFAFLVSEAGPGRRLLASIGFTINCKNGDGLRSMYRVRDDAFLCLHS